MNVIEEGRSLLKAEQRAARIAARIGNYSMKKTFRRAGEGKLELFYSIKGDFDNANLSQLGIVAELLTSTFEDDLTTTFASSEPEIVRIFEPKVSLSHSVVYLYAELKFNTTWEPTEDFWEI